MDPKNLTKRRFKTSEASRAELAKKLKIERDKDRQLVKGVFKYYEVPNGVMEFCFKKYAEDPVEKFTMYDNQVYSIPLGVAKHINNNTWYPIHEYSKNEDGSSMQRIGQKIRRMAFQSLEFMDMDGVGDNINRIITVEKVVAQ
jgi:hypothetical protein